ncbi:general stress protein [Aneurinibacillus tyrosinisolvens]|uniref:general stress protein n=1 Tax=Aneurinibacillus tyrosinisolvens TaxID=1443435 RepID=UPI00069CA3DB|nr:general stress protein [Aneurinibacillus tyrosinisolvens]
MCYSPFLKELLPCHHKRLNKRIPFDTVANLFKNRGDELRNEFVNLGFSQTEAESYESKLDEGKVLVVVKSDNKDVGLFL